MRYILLIIICIVILCVILLKGGFQNEKFQNADDPSAIFKRVRSLLDKYDKPEVWGHAAQVMTMDPGELARMHLKIAN